MNILNTLLTTPWTLPVSLVDPIKLNWIGNIIKLIIEGVGITGIGIVVFTLILKTIVLPLDVYSRYSSKKQALVMEQMREPMEKLQKQYANDKNMYNAKVMELYKKNGYSMFSACIPMIVSMAIFIIVFGAFSTYSQYANLETYRGMVEEYRTSVTQFDKHDNNVQDGFLQFTYVYNNEIYKISDDGTLLTGNDGKTLTLTGGKYLDNGKETGITEQNLSDYRNFSKVYTDYNAFVSFYDTHGNYKVNDSEGNIIATGTLYLYGTDNADVAVSEELVKKENVVTYQTVQGKTVKQYYEEYNENALINKVKEYTQIPASQKAAEYYNSHKHSFLWIKNIWYPDSMLNKEFPTFKDFQKTLNKAELGSDLEYSYNDVTANLSQEKSNYNGYFVLIVLSIALMLLQQWISMKSTKATADLGTVNGQANSTNKMMMVIMPLMFGVFAFMYSAAFSIYMITSTLHSIITTLIINKILDVKFEKKRREAEIAKLTGRTAPNVKKKK